MTLELIVIHETATITILAALFLFCQICAPDSRSGPRMVSVTGIAVVATAVAVRTGVLHAGSFQFDFLYYLISYAVLFLLCIPTAQFCFRMGSWEALLCAVGGYTMQNLSSSVSEGVLMALEDLVGHMPSVTTFTATRLLSALLIFSATWLVLIKPIRRQGVTNEKDLRTVLLIGAVILFNIAFDLAIKSLYLDGNVSHGILYVLRAAQTMTCVFLLVMEYELFYVRHLRDSNALLKSMMDEERRHYQISRDSIEAINLRCHDIRHQIRTIGKGRGISTRASLTISRVRSTSTTQPSGRETTRSTRSSPRRASSARAQGSASPAQQTDGPSHSCATSTSMPSSGTSSTTPSRPS